MNFKRITAAASALAMTAGLAAYAPSIKVEEQPITAYAASSYNYAEALQKSMFFYEVQQSGKLPDWNAVQWRDDSMMKEDGTPADVIDGGWYDAGDHFKFTLTNAYTASVLAWGLIEYKDAVKKAGLYDLYMNNLKWGLDYISRCDLGDEVIGTIGPSQFDHKWWGSPEVYIRKYKIMDGKGKEERPYDTMTCSTVTGYMAAALAEGSILLKDEDPTLAASYLKQAKSLFERADKVRSDDGQGTQKEFYNIQQHGNDVENYVDELMYAANWLYRATGDKSYLTKCETDYIPHFPLENQSTDKKYTWGFCWDDSTQAAAFLYAQNTGSPEWAAHVKKHLQYWMGVGNSDKSSGIKAFDNITPKGLSYLFQWGCLRHSTTTAWLAKLASDTILKDDTAFAAEADKWGNLQMNYCFGDNEMGISYVLGMGDEWPSVFHHRAASGIHDDHWNELGSTAATNEGWQTEYAHTLYGALIGGPDSKGNYGSYSVSDYQYTEVAIDYNAGFTAALCAMVDDYGGSPLTNFPPTETPKWAEWEVAAVLNGQPAKSYTEIKAWAMNHTAWPARVAKDVKFRYFFDVTELLDKGLTIDQIKVETKSQQYSEGEQGYAHAEGPFQYKGNIYYADIVFDDGRAIMPTGQSEHRDEVQFRISIPDAIEGKSTAGAWDCSNDWSYLGGLADATDLKKDDSLNEHIPMYVNGILVWGEEPDGTKPTKSDYTFTRNGGGSQTDPTEPTTGNTPKATLWGDSNCSGEVKMNDAVLVMQALANDDLYGLNGSEKTHLTEQGEINADVYANGTGLTNMDALSIQKFLIGAVTELPESYK
ncbi:MAG: glycoside hydrolase family 9 protein [Ruminococcus sp.]|nr:glycoside hydrolase family 9 protein [Ruminococcus sp.]